MKEEVVVRLVQFPHVIAVKGASAAFTPRPLFEPPAQHIGGRLQVDHQIGGRYVTSQKIVEPLIDEQLVVVKVEVGVDLVLVEQVVANRRLAEEVGLPQRHLLTVSREEVEQLRLEGGARPARIQIAEKGILRLVKDDRGVEPGAEPLRQRRLAHGERSFNRDVAEFQRGPKYN